MRTKKLFGICALALAALLTWIARAYATEMLLSLMTF